MILSYFFFFTFFACIVMGIIGLLFDPKGGANRAFAVLSFTVSIWAFGDIFYNMAVEYKTACFWYNVTAIGWCGLIFASFYYYTELLGYFKKIPLFVKIFVFIWTIVLIFVEFNERLDLVPTTYGYVEILNILSPGFYLFNLSLLIVNGGGMALVFRKIFTTHSMRIKKMMTAFLIINFLTYFIAIIVNLLQTITGRNIPSFGAFFMLILIAGILYLMRRYRLMIVDYRILQKEAFNILSDYIFILSPGMKIVNINNAARNGIINADNDIFSIFTDEEEFKLFYVQSISMEADKSKKRMLFKGKNGENIPAYLSICHVFDDFKDHIGAILIAKPLTEFEKIADEYNITSQERRIIAYLVEGLLNKEISSKMDISASTVKNHMTNIYQKTNTANKVELVRLFFMHEI